MQIFCIFRLSQYLETDQAEVGNLNRLMKNKKIDRALIVIWLRTKT